MTAVDRSEVGALLLNLNATAIHKAGHAVIGRVLGLTCSGATIVAIRASDQYCRSFITHPVSIPFVWKRRGKFRESRSVFIGRILAHMAGAEAELELLGHVAVGDGVDRRQIDLMADSMGVSGEQWERYELRMRRQTRRLVRKHRRKIERVAAALEERGTLQAEEIDLLMA